MMDRRTKPRQGIRSNASLHGDIERSEGVGRRSTGKPIEDWERARWVDRGNTEVLQLRPSKKIGILATRIELRICPGDGVHMKMGQMWKSVYEELYVAQVLMACFV